MELFTLFWLDGYRQVIKGTGIENAVTSAGISAGALRALDFWACGENQEYEWSGAKWKKRSTVPNKHGG